MRFIDLFSFAECISEEIDDIQFKCEDNKFFLLTPIDNQTKVRNWLNENKVTNISLSFYNNQVKLSLS